MGYNTRRFARTLGRAGGLRPGEGTMRAGLVISAVLAATLSVGSTPVPAGEEGPAAMVEAIENAPGAGVEFLDYVYPGKQINLGDSGKLVLSYFDTCLTETVLGGRLTVAPGGSDIDGGQISVKAFPCQGPQMVVTAETSEAGATVSRVTPFDGQDWSEWTVKSTQPLFKWPASEGQTFVRVFDMETDPPEMVWQGEVKGSHVAYPVAAPKLRNGIPYRVQVSRWGTPAITAVFPLIPISMCPTA